MRRPTRRMLHDVIILVPLLINTVKNHQKIYFFHIFPPEGNFDIGAGDGVGGDHLEPLEIQRNHKNIFRTKIVHTSGTFFKNNVKTYL